MPRLEVSFSRIGMWPRMDAGKRTYRRRELIGQGTDAWHPRRGGSTARKLDIDSPTNSSPSRNTRSGESSLLPWIRGLSPTLKRTQRQIAKAILDAGRRLEQLRFVSVGNREGHTRRPRAIHNPVDLRARRKVWSQPRIGRKLLQVARPEGISRLENPPGSRTGRAGVSIRPNQSPTRRPRHSPAGVSRTRQSLARNPAPELAPFRTSGCPSSCRGAAHRFVLHWPLVSGGLFTLRSAALHWHACIH